MQVTTFNFHEIAIMRASGIREKQLDVLRNVFKGFEVPNASDQPAQVEILPLPDNLFREIRPEHYKNQGRYYVDFSDDNKPLIVSPYRGKLDVVVVPEKIIRVYVSNRDKAGDKVANFAQYALKIYFARKQAMLMHGAVLNKNGKPLVITGVSGAGKTSLLLHMLNDQWEYLSDNCFLCFEGNALAFRSRVVFNTYHTQVYPHLFKNCTIPVSTPKKIKQQTLMRSLGTRHLPHYLHSVGRLSRVMDPYISRQPEQLFPGIVTHQKLRPDIFIVLIAGHELAFKETEPAVGMRQMALVNQIAWGEFDEVNRLMEANTGQRLLHFEASLHHNYSDRKFYQLMVPRGTKVPELYGYLQENLAALNTEKRPGGAS